MKVTLKELSRILNLSEAAISMALNDKPGVSDRTRELVKRTAQQYGYERNEYAHSLARRQSKRIGLIVPQIENPYYGRMVSCVNRALQERGFRMEIAVSDEDPDQENRQIRDLIAHQVAGILISPMNRHVQESISCQILIKQKMPVLFIGSRYPGFPFSCVMANLKKGSYDLVRYLFRQGRKNIHLLTGLPNILAFQLRIDGCRQAFKDEGSLWLDSHLHICDQVDFYQAYYTTHKLLDMKEIPDAILAVNDYMALGAMKALYERRVLVPEQVAVAGYDDIIYASVSAIGITTVVQDLERMAALSVDRLLHKIQQETEEKEETVYLPATLVVRASTASGKTGGLKIKEEREC